MREKIMRDMLEFNDAEYAAGRPTMPDVQYDLLKKAFREQYPNSPYNKQVGSTPESNKVKLPYVLGSLNKVKADGSYRKWNAENDGEKVYWAKLDGVSALVTYVNGVYEQAYTRGDGEFGQDITEKLRQACPAKLRVKTTGSYRAEVMLIGDHHKQLGYKTRRNGVAGILNRDGIEQCEYLVVMFYEVVSDDDMSQTNDTELSRIKRMEEVGLGVAPYEYGLKTETELINLLFDWKTKYSYDIDGVVVALDNSEREDTYYPELKVAFKVNEDATICNVVGLTWQVGRTGRVVPVVNIEPTEIGGVTVSNATGFNYKFVADNGVGAGCKVGIYRSGDVIPYIDFVQNRVHMEGELLCPSCYNPTTLKGVDMVCESTYCEDRDALRLEYFLTRIGCENVTAVTLKKLGIQTIEDVYEATVDGIASVSGFGVKRGEQIVSEFKKTLNTTPAKFLSSFGITGVGKTASENILKVYEFDKLWDLTVFDLMRVDGVGDILANNFVDEISDHKVVYELMKGYGLSWSTASNSLMGKVFCLTGKSEMKRDELVNMIESNGGYVKGMSKKVDFCVTDDPESNTGKAKKAREYGKPVISYDELMGMMED